MAAAAPAPSLRDRHWHVVNIVVGSGVVAAIQVGKAAIVTPMLQKDLGLDLAAAGWLTGIIAVLGLLGGIPAGLMRLLAAEGVFSETLARRFQLIELGAALLSDAPSSPRDLIRMMNRSPISPSLSLLTQCERGCRRSKPYLESPGSIGWRTIRTRLRYSIRR